KQVASANDEITAVGDVAPAAGSSFSSESTGAGTLADDEALAALREKLSSSN
ncbi:MAG TPA: 30S ribosomal protein S1, partial [Cryobacterium sp.]|nr:30S ribosomal protein S1 [Cryobacterium sp.]